MLPPRGTYLAKEHARYNPAKFADSIMPAPLRFPLGLVPNTTSREDSDAHLKNARSMKVAYLTNCFGSQSHTFIRREVRALRQLGLDVSLYGVRRDAASCATDAQDLVRETSYLYPLSALSVLKHNARFFKSSPAHYAHGALRALLSEEFSLKRRAKMLYHYVVSAEHASRLIADGATHIHAHFMNVSASIAMYAAWHSKIPYSITVHSAGTYKTPHILGVAQKLADAQFLVMISHYNIDYFDAITPCRRKCHVVRCGMDLRDFPLRPPRKRDETAPARLLGVGRFVEKKGFIYLVEAAKLLQQRGVSFELTIIGDGPLLEEVRQRSRELGVDKQVHLVGRQGSEEVRRAMSQADAVIVPSVTSQSGEKEGLPVVIMEAMATGLPVVASDHSGIPEIVRPHETGILTPERDAEAIARGIEEALSLASIELTIRAAQLVEQEFNIARVAEQRRELFSRYDRS